MTNTYDEKARALAKKIREHRCDSPNCWLDVQDEDCLARELVAALAACAREGRQEHWQEFLDARGVIDTCTKCGGTGTVVYGSTATWRGGIGGQMMTNDVCDKCWGSGDEHKHWTNLRALDQAAGGKEKGEER